MRALEGQLAFDLFDKPKPRNPFSCIDSGATVDIGGGKTFCKPWQRWTNCREVGHCVFAEYADAE